MSVYSHLSIFFIVNTVKWPSWMQKFDLNIFTSKMKGFFSLKEKVTKEEK